MVVAHACARLLVLAPSTPRNPYHGAIVELRGPDCGPLCGTVAGSSAGPRADYHVDGELLRQALRLLCDG